MPENANSLPSLLRRLFQKAFPRGPYKSAQTEAYASSTLNFAHGNTDNSQMSEFFNILRGTKMKSNEINPKLGPLLMMESPLRIIIHVYAIVYRPNMRSPLTRPESLHSH